MFPLSLEEYIGIKKFYGKTLDPNLMIELNNYILEGGFPYAIQYANLSEKRTYVRAVISVNRETLDKYIKVLVDEKIFYQCDRFDMKSKKSLKGEKKYYLSDLSFYFA